MRRRDHMRRRKTIGLSIDRLQTIVTVLPNFHINPSSKQAGPANPPTSLLIRRQSPRSSIMSWTRPERKRYREKRSGLRGADTPVRVPKALPPNVPEAALSGIRTNASRQE